MEKIIVIVVTFEPIAWAIESTTCGWFKRDNPPAALARRKSPVRAANLLPPAISDRSFSATPAASRSFWLSIPE